MWSNVSIIGRHHRLRILVISPCTGRIVTSGAHTLQGAGPGDRACVVFSAPVSGKGASVGITQSEVARFSSHPRLTGNYLKFHSSLAPFDSQLQNPVTEKNKGKPPTL